MNKEDEITEKEFARRDTEIERLQTELRNAQEKLDIVLAEFAATDVITYKKRTESAEAKNASLTQELERLRKQIE